MRDNAIVDALNIYRHKSNIGSMLHKSSKLCGIAIPINLRANTHFHTCEAMCTSIQFGEHSDAHSSPGAGAGCDNQIARKLTSQVSGRFEHASLSIGSSVGTLRWHPKRSNLTSSLTNVPCVQSVLLCKTN